MVTGIHVLVAASLVRGGALPVEWANVTAFFVATVCSYVLNTRWSFSKTVGWLTFARFATVAAIGAILAWGISHALVLRGFGEYQVIGCLVLVLPLLSFGAHRFWTYRS